MMGIYEKSINPKYIEVSTSDRFFKPVARIITKKVLKNAVTQKCDLFKAGVCQECLAEEKEVDCITAWSLTIGKGQKIY